jgi:uncharacterized protein (TIGR03437 family)
VSRVLVAFVFLHSIAHADVQTLGSLPTGAQANCIQLDSSGNIYVAGILNNHVFSAKLTADGSQIIYMTTIGGSKLDVAQAIAVGSDGSAYVTGYTQSTDFPTTPGSMQPSIAPPASILQRFGFALKLNAQGAIQYATYLGGTALTQGNGVTLDASGNAYITGTVIGNYSGYPTTPGAVAGYPGDSGSPNPRFGSAPQTGFVLKLDPTGSTGLISILGFGGSQIALDASGNMVAAGALSGPTPTTPNAFQTSAARNNCFTSFFTGPALCNYQHVAKIDPSGNTLIFGTYVSGNWGATPNAMAFDADGNIVLAGATNSPDYPTTPGAYQPQYLFNPNESFEPNATFVAPAPAGFVTKLNASGTALIWSTFFSGSGNAPSYQGADGDTINGMAIDAAGNIVVFGTALSTDLPGLWNTPVAQRPLPGPRNPTAFVTRLTPDGVKLSPTQLLSSIPTSALSNGLAVRTDGSAVVIPQLARVTVADPPRVASISDTDNTRLVRVAPGQLLTLWGTKLSPTGQAQPVGPFPAFWNGITATFNGIAAPILYASGDQVNLQVPFEIAGQTEVTMQVAGQSGDPQFSESFILELVPRQPSVVISGANLSGPLFGGPGCAPGTRCIQPLAINEDGSTNDSNHPAPTGSVVTIFVNGIGITSPALGTGDVSTAVTELSPGMSQPAIATQTIPQSSTTLAQVQIQVLAYKTSPVSVPLDVRDPQNGVPIRGVSVLIWVVGGD